MKKIIVRVGIVNIIAFLSIALCMVPPASATAQERALFPSGILSAPCYLMSGQRINVLTEDEEGKALLECYDAQAVKLWSSYLDGVKPFTAMMYQVRQRNMLVIISSISGYEDWRVSMVDEAGVLLEQLDILGCLQIPVVLEAGIFYLKAEGTESKLWLRDWEGLVNPVELPGQRAPSMIWWEGQELGDAYVLVLNIPDAQGSLNKAACMFNAQGAFKWAHIFEERFKRYFIPAIQADFEGNTLFWLDENTVRAGQSHLLMVDKQGQKSWSRKIASGSFLLSAIRIDAKPEGGFLIWGSTNEDQALFKLSIDQHGEFLALECRQGGYLQPHYGLEPYSSILSEDGKGFTMLPFSDLPLYEVDIQIDITV